MVGHSAQGPDGPVVLGEEGAGIVDLVRCPQTSSAECGSPRVVLAGQAQPGLETKTSVQMKSASVPTTGAQANWALSLGRHVPLGAASFL